MTQTPSPPPPGHVPPGETSGKAIASLVVSIASLFSCPLLGIVGIVLGHSALNDIQRTPAVTGDGLAKAGIIVGWVAIALSIVGFCISVGMLALMAGAQTMH